MVLFGGKGKWSRRPEAHVRESGRGSGALEVNGVGKSVGGPGTGRQARAWLTCGFALYLTHCIKIAEEARMLHRILPLALRALLTENRASLISEKYPQTKKHSLVHYM